MGRGIFFNAFHSHLDFAVKKVLMITGLASMLISCATTSSSSNTESAVNAEVSASDVVLDPIPDNRPGTDFDELWGEKVPDPYRWLEDISKPEVQAWVKAQDLRARNYLKSLPTREQFASELADLLYYSSITTPVVNKNRAFFRARGARDEKSIIYVEELNRPETRRVLIDPQTLSEDGSISVGDIYPSPDGKLMAYTLKKNNADQATVYVMDVDSGQNLPDKIEGGRYADPEWLKDSSGFYYTYFRIDPSIPVDQRPGMTDVRFHKLGTSESEDKLIISALHDATKFHWVRLSNDDRWLKYMIQDGWNGNSLKLFDRTKPEVSVEFPTKPDTTYDGMILDDVLYLLTNDSAPNYKVVKISLSGERPEVSESAWHELVPESKDAVVQDFTVIGDKLFVVSLKDVVHELDVYDLSGNHLKKIELPDKGSLGGLSGRDKDEGLYFQFTSYKLPASVYRLDPKSLELSVWSEVETKAKTDDIISEQLFATSKDGTKVPMFVLRHKDTKLDGTAPTIIYGYGGFNVSISPSFNPAVYPWLERGGIFVYSVLRGGSEYGETWHQAGMKLKKQNVFDDYYAVAEHLIEHKYTRRESVAAYGGSNGGLLTGAALTQRPDLYGAIVCAVPLLDMVRYHLFGSGRTWIGEYGSVEQSEAEFKAIRAYSPYSNVKKTRYPAVLFLGADSDDRVDPMHARKMTAAIQDATTSDNPVILRIEKNSGHGGADLTRQRIAQWADIYAFLRKVLK